MASQLPYLKLSQAEIDCFEDSNERIFLINNLQKFRRGLGFGIVELKELVKSLTDCDCFEDLTTGELELVEEWMRELYYGHEFAQEPVAAVKALGVDEAEAEAA